MTTSAIASSLRSGSSNQPTQVQNKSLGLKPSDFITMMVTQLQHQDPTQPASNEQLLSQMSQIGQLQSSTDLQASLKSMVQQSSIGSASSLIGKMVHGIDATNNRIHGVVTSVKVGTDGVNLQLDTGAALPLTGVSSIANPGSSAAPATTGA